MPKPGEIVDAVVKKLRADANVTGLVSTRIHKALPVRPAFPCVLVFIPDSLPWDTKDAKGMEAIVQVNCWSRDDRDQDSIRSLQKVVKNALHEQSLTLASETHVLTREVSSFPSTGEDGVTVMGVSRYQALVHA